MNLREVTEEKMILSEISVPKRIKKLDKSGFRWFGLPHGEYNEKTLKILEYRFSGALSVVQGNDKDKYKLNRVIVNSETKFRDKSIGVIIPSYNYGHFLIDAIESVLRQKVKPDKILISDDCSNDDTVEIGKYYASKYPDLIKFNRNKENMGIVKHFQKAVKLLGTDYVCFLGADNRFRSDYIEKCAEVLDSDERIAIAYTDLAIFGDRAAEVYADAPKNWKGEIKEQHKIINYPNFNKKTRKSIRKRNFIHGSSMYKMKAYKEAGGYKDIKKRPEDHSLFLRMINKGWSAKRVPFPVLEYRQHSLDQANTALGLQAQLTLFKNELRRLRGVETELNIIKASKFWKLLNIYKNPKTAIPGYSKKFIKKFHSKLDLFLNDLRT